MKDKFEIFMEIMMLEARTNHYGIYIPIGQLRDVFVQVNKIYSDWDESKTLQENVRLHFKRRISPMGDCGKNRL